MKILLTIPLIAVAAASASAQLSRQPNPAPTTAADPAEPLYAVSLFAVRPPEPREYERHDIIMIIVNESSSQTSEQTLETSKETDATASIGATLSVEELLNLRLENSSVSDLELLRYAAQREFEGEGEYERTDRITDRLSATVIDVKPNGVLVLEARRFTAGDEETKTFILSGNCRSEDVTEQNTIQSNQLAELRLEVRHEGEVRDAASKGPLTRFVEWLLPF
ncbi:MAG: flagellar basal body L-ring protein FlgH [Phycisphaera sp.]|nr:MAG: flagellar basal body L-ring protein FlgH [Phycisphaera sp.]